MKYFTCLSFMATFTHWNKDKKIHLQFFFFLKGHTTWMILRDPVFQRLSPHKFFGGWNERNKMWPYKDTKLSQNFSFHEIGFELRAPCSQSKHSTTWVTPPSPFCGGRFGDGGLKNCLPRLASKGYVLDLSLF
jgi:hypothetical protein